jgi:L-ascorbate metabolism protein UlaG (beta-lactamase superfamily)
VKIKWLGHASFLITSSTGIKVITDPYAIEERLRYGEIKESADIVTVSHDHHDHSNVNTVRGNPEVARGTTEIKGIQVKGIHAYHDEAQGEKRGKNTIFYLKVDGVKVCHLGDIGHQLDSQHIAEIGEVDVLLVPVGGYYTVDATTAGLICKQLKPKVIIPMHFKTSKCTFPISSVDNFLQGEKNISQPNTSEVEFIAGEFPDETQITVLTPAL